MKVVLSQCFGGFNVSQKVFEYLDQLEAPKHIDEMYLYDNRSDPYLVRAVEYLGDDANGAHSKLVIVDWPSFLPYKIKDYDGWENIDLDMEKFLSQHAEEVEKAHTPLSHDLHHYRNFLNNKQGQ